MHNLNASLTSKSIHHADLEDEDHDYLSDKDESSPFFSQGEQRQSALQRQMLSTGTSMLNGCGPQRHF